MNFSLSRELLRSASKLAIVAATAGILAGCSSNDSFSSAGDGSSSTSTFATIEPDGQDFVGGAAYWGAKYEADRENIAAGMGFARNLRMMGGARQAISVLKEIVMKAPDDPRVLSEYGKALTAAGRVQDALPFLARSTQINGDDWTTFSAYGVALDQTGNHTSARTNYQVALGISPGNPTIESNMAMSHVLEGEIDKAELILRRLVSRPDATPQMRQNLAMISAIKGNSAEAEQLAREDLVPSDATNNLTLLQQFDARNVAINIQPLTAPEPAPVIPDASALVPEPAATTSTPEIAVPDLAATAELAAPEISTTPSVPAAPATPTAVVQKPAPVMMAPILDDEDPIPAKPPAPKKIVKPVPAPTSVSLTAPAKTPATSLTPTSASPVVTGTIAKPVAALRRSYDDYRQNASIEIANAAH
ncbi:MAG: tetratricopeptide repeat protein [Micropepsaceae bacterium]